MVGTVITNRSEVPGTGTVPMVFQVQFKVRYRYGVRYSRYRYRIQYSILGVSGNVVLYFFN